MGGQRTKESVEWTCKPDPVTTPVFRSGRPAIIPLAPRLPAESSDLPGGFGRASLERPPIWSCSVWGFPCPSCHHAGGALLPHLFTLATPAFRPEFGGVFSVALSLGSPPLAVNQHTAHGVRTFLPGHDIGRGDRPAHSTDHIGYGLHHRDTSEGNKDAALRVSDPGRARVRRHSRRTRKPLA